MASIYSDVWSTRKSFWVVYIRTFFVAETDKMKKGTRAVFDLEIGELTNNQVRVSFKLTLFLFDAAAAAAFWV